MSTHVNPLCVFLTESLKSAQAPHGFWSNSSKWACITDTTNENTSSANMNLDMAK